ncbi:hypothetical protein [Nonomuraea sp. NPDC001023]|uniref:hypothetical protein n=1 Tax=unclassified Nonomuraea TaxID=2593643 RepID=UPI00332B73C9
MPAQVAGAAGHGDRVHVGPVADRGAVAGVQDRDHAVAADAGPDLQARLPQRRRHQGRGAPFLAGRLGVAVDLAA